MVLKRQLYLLFLKILLTHYLTTLNQGSSQVTRPKQFYNLQIKRASFQGSGWGWSFL